MHTAILYADLLYVCYLSQNKSFRNTISVKQWCQTSSDPDLVLHLAGPDLDPNFLQEEILGLKIAYTVKTK